METTEICLFRPVPGYRKVYLTRDEDIRKELGMTNSMKESSLRS